MFRRFGQGFGKVIAREFGGFSFWLAQAASINNIVKTSTDFIRFQFTPVQARRYPTPAPASATSE
jgi:hypothetical protein